MNIKKILIGGIFSILLAVSTTVSAQAATLVNVSNLQPDWGAIGGGGVFSAYIGPPAYGYESPGSTAFFDGRQAGIIRAGFNTDPADDEGLFAFQPTVTIDVLAAGVLTYDVQNQTGVNPVWMTIEIDTGTVGNRGDNTTYQFVPTSNPSGWNTFDAGAGLWQKWNDNNGDTTGNPLILLSDISVANTGLNVVRAYLRLGMGESYYNGGTGTTAWVDKTTIGGVTYDFVVAGEPTNIPSQCDQNIAYNLIEGTNRPDRINGTSGNDLIFALGGPDSVDGKGGNDCIVGGAGPDSLKGGSDDDVILGGDGADSIDGGSNNDQLYGENGADSINGGDDNDNLFGGNGADFLRGEAGTDTLDGGSQMDSANGGSGTDTCTAESEAQCEI